MPELHFHAGVMDAVATGNIDKILSYGTNAAQAAAQPMRAVNKTAVTSFENISVGEDQSLAVFLINGVKVEHSNLRQERISPLLSFAKYGADIEMMKSAEPFLREIACLHGISDRPLHPNLLETVYDEDEALSMDAIDQFQQSLSPC
jgi:hypothetical protein